MRKHKDKTNRAARGLTWVNPGRCSSFEHGIRQIAQSISVLLTTTMRGTGTWRRLLGGGGVLLCLGAPAWSQQSCTPDHVDVPKEQVRATANFLANLARSPGSLRAELARLMANARQELEQAKPPGDACLPTCRVTGLTHVLLSIVTNKLRPSYTDFDKCEERFLQTSNQPLRFGPRHVRLADELAAWLSEVAQGFGQDGTALYRICSGKCSPRYFLNAAQQADGLVATLDVICGHARDVSDNTYTVSTAYRWECAPVP